MLRCRPVRLFALTLGVAWLPLAAGAALIEIVSVTRSVTATADHFDGDPSSSTKTGGADNTTIAAFAKSVGTFDPFFGVTADSFQTPTLSADSIELNASGDWAAGEFDGGTFTMESIFDATFNVTAPSSFELFGLANLPYGGTNAVTLWDPDGAVIVDFMTTLESTPVVWEFGELDPGLHRLRIVLARSGGTYEIPPGGHSQNTSLTLTFIPEPGTGLLVALGLLGLAGGRSGRTPS